MDHQERELETKQLLTKDIISTKDGVISTKDGLSPTHDGARVEQATQIKNDPLSSTYMVTCRVCQSRIDVSQKEDQYVVKCGHCNEATPIQNAPKGKKYVRCTCNCLLVCKSSSQRIACPRPNCKRVITLQDIQNDLSWYTSAHPGMSQVVCGHCKQMFLFNLLENALARCPHCRKVSSAGRQFARGRGTFYMFLGGLLFLIVLIAFLLSGKISQHPVLSFFYFVLLVISFFLLIRSVHYCTMKVSHIEIDRTQYNSI